MKIIKSIRSRNLSFLYIFFFRFDSNVFLKSFPDLSYIHTKNAILVSGPTRLPQCQSSNGRSRFGDTDMLFRNKVSTFTAQRIILSSFIKNSLRTDFLVKKGQKTINLLVDFIVLIC